MTALVYDKDVRRRQLHGDKLALITAFVAVAEHKSFVGAAHAMGVSTSTVTRHIAQLEAHLGLRLLQRTTRHVALTEAGALYNRMCNEVFGRLADADQMMASLKSVPRGELRLSAPIALGRLQISPFIAEFHQRYPDIRVEADFTDRYVDLIEEGYDLSVRIGELPDSSLVARKVASNHRILVAAPGYFDKLPMPTKPADLADHECFSFTRYAQLAWTFVRGEETSTVTVGGKFRSDSSDAIYQAVTSGAGIGLVARYICHRDLAEGRLVPLLPDWRVTPETAIYVVYPSRLYLAPKVRAFSDFFAARFKAAEWAQTAAA